MKKEKTKEKILLSRLRWISIGIIILCILIPDIFLALGFGFGILWGTICFEMATEHKRKGIAAYLLGLFFGLFGILFYWIYLKIRGTKIVEV